MSAIISKVKLHSLAEAAGIEEGEELININGLTVQDIIEYGFCQNDNLVKLCLKKNDVSRIVKIFKHPDQDLGLEFQSAVFDKIKLCQNNCIFCFVQQMIPGMRKSLYVKDDDYRLSFLYGNFLTLTNMTDDDFQRIFQYHLSPLYVSVHATDSKIRCQMLRNQKAGDILSELKDLIKGGIEIHTQIVCCPAYNDGKILEKTFRDLSNLYPGVQSMAVVPVGLTKNRKNLTKLRTFTKDEAKKICQNVTKWQEECRENFGKNFIYLADEFYLLAEKNIPDAEIYDDYPQLENGIGLTRLFLDDWTKNIEKVINFSSLEDTVIPVGEAAYKILQPYMVKLNKKIKGKHQILSVRNNFFGGAVNVTGLLTAGDILENCKNYQRLILPKVVLNKDDMFLDGVSLSEFKKLFNGKVQVAGNAKELLQMLVKK